MQPRPQWYLTHHRAAQTAVGGADHVPHRHGVLDHITLRVSAAPRLHVAHARDLEGLAAHQSQFARAALRSTHASTAYCQEPALVQHVAKEVVPARRRRVQLRKERSHLLALRRSRRVESRLRERVDERRADGRVLREGRGQRHHGRHVHQQLFVYDSPRGDAPTVKLLGERAWRQQQHRTVQLRLQQVLQGELEAQLLGVAGPL